MLLSHMSHGVVVISHDLHMHCNANHFHHVHLRDPSKMQTSSLFDIIFTVLDFIQPVVCVAYVLMYFKPLEYYR